MNDLTKQAGDNIGGFNELQIIDVDNIVTLPNHTDFIISDNIVTLVDFFDLAFTPKTLKVNDGETNNDKGIIYKPVISFFHQKDNAISTKTLQDFLEKKVIAKIKDNNGNTKIVGSLTSPLRLNYKLVTKESYDGRPGYNVTLQGLSLVPSLFFTGSAVIYIP